MARGETGEVDFQPVETPRVVEEYLALELDRHVVAIGEGRYSIRELAVPMRIVGRKEDVVLGKEVRHVAQGLLLGSQDTNTRPQDMYSDGLAFNNGASKARYSYSSSICSIQNGTQPIPASRKATRRS